MKKTKTLKTLLLSSLCFIETLLPASESLSPRINSFAINFYQEALADSKKNEIFSPYSLFSCLSMAYLGSDGSTAEEMQNTLQIETFSQDLASSLYNLSQEISSTDEKIQLNIANSLWVDREFPVLDSYTNAIESMGGKSHCISFKNAENSSEEINQWVEKETRKTISKLLNPFDICKNTKIMLINAIYFKGSWKKPFEKKHTNKAPFFCGEGTQKNCDMMSQTSQFPYYENANYQLVILPYKPSTKTERELGCFILLPKKQDDLPLLENSLDQLQGWISKCKEAKIDLKLPRFEIKHRYDLIPTLEKMGMKKPFSLSANFSKINANADLRISKAIHQAFFSLDEDGSVASAATAIGMTCTCSRIALPPPIFFHANHPFIFGIVDLKSNVMLFLGKMLEP